MVSENGRKLLHEIPELGIKVFEGTLTEFQQLDANPNGHTERGMDSLEKGMDKFGWMGAMTAAADGVVIDGNARHETAYMKFGERVLIIETDGTVPIINQRTDVKDSKDEKARLMAVAANRIAELNLAWDMDVVVADKDAPDMQPYFSPSELAAFGEGEANVEPLGYYYDVEEKLDILLTTDVRRIVLYFTADEFEGVIKRLDAVGEAHGLDNHTEMFLHLLKDYEMSQPHETA